MIDLATRARACADLAYCSDSATLNECADTLEAKDAEIAEAHAICTAARCGPGTLESRLRLLAADTVESDALRSRLIAKDAEIARLTAVTNALPADAYPDSVIGDRACAALRALDRTPIKDPLTTEPADRARTAAEDHDLAQRCQKLLDQLEPGTRFHDRAIAVLREQAAEIARLRNELSAATEWANAFTGGAAAIQKMAADAVQTQTDLAALRAAVMGWPEHSHRDYCDQSCGAGCTNHKPCNCGASAANAARAAARKLAGEGFEYGL